MSINKAIAESLGYTVTKARSGYWALRLNGGGNIGNFVTENLAWDYAPDFDHNLNDAWSLLSFLSPLGRVNLTSRLPDNSQDAARAICEAYCQFKGIAIPEE